MGRTEKKKSLNQTVAVLARKLGYSKMKAESDIINGSDAKIYKRSGVSRAFHVQVCHLITTFDDQKVFNP